MKVLVVGLEEDKAAVILIIAVVVEEYTINTTSTNSWQPQTTR